MKINHEETNIICTRWINSCNKDNDIFHRLWVYYKASKDSCKIWSLHTVTFAPTKQLKLCPSTRINAHNSMDIYQIHSKHRTFICAEVCGNRVVCLHFITTFVVKCAKRSWSPPHTCIQLKKKKWRKNWNFECPYLANGWCKFKGASNYVLWLPWMKLCVLYEAVKPT